MASPFLKLSARHVLLPISGLLRSLVGEVDDGSHRQRPEELSLSGQSRSPIES